MANGTTGIWADGGEREQKVRKLFAEKHSASEIATKLGGDVTRSAVLGKMKRLGLVRGDGPRHPRCAPQARPVCEKPVISVVPLNIPFSELESGLCKWPSDAPADVDGPHVFCGNPSKDGKPYCSDHCRLAYQPPKALTRPGYIELGKSSGGVFGRGG